MDSFSSLLNLNFMASLRTGNLIVDMLIATLIPVISFITAYFFTHTWPELVRDGIEICAGGEQATIIPLYMRDEELGLGVEENLLLQEAVSLYVSRRVKPKYPFGSYSFQRIPAPRSDSGSLIEIIQKTYSVGTVPQTDISVKVRSGLEMATKIHDDSGKNTVRSVDDKNRGKAWKKRSIVLKTTTVPHKAHCHADPSILFVNDALTWYKQQVNVQQNKTLYLYRPVVSLSRRAKNRDRGALISYQRYLLSHTKTFNTLFFRQKTKLVALIDEFLTKSGKYAIPGFPHRLVLLLYGPPGTGKTSLIKAIATYTMRNIIAVDISRVQTYQQLMNCMYNTTLSVEKEINDNDEDEKTVKLQPDNVLYMLEDVDAASTMAAYDQVEQTAAHRDHCVKQCIQNPSLKVNLEDCNAVDILHVNASCKHQMLSSVAILSRPSPTLPTKGLLDGLSGILDSPGRIVIMTTNHIDRLHPALLRPGVVTMKLHMALFDPDSALEMIRHYFQLDNREEIPLLDIIHNTMSLSKKVGQDGGFSPAELEQLCAESETLQDLLQRLQQGSRLNVY